MANYENYTNEKYLNKKVEIKYTCKPAYTRERLVGLCGVVTRMSSDELGVLIDGKTNRASSYGIYWFNKNEVKLMKDESEDIKMEGFNYVAIVKLVEDYNKKNYAFALYDEDFELITQKDAMVVVNARFKDNRILGVVKEIMSVEEFYSIDKNKGTKITAEVVGVVDMNGYIAREDEKERLKKLAEKKVAIEKELEAEINKRKSIEYYKAMAEQYSDNPKLAELVTELESLGL